MKKTIFPLILLLFLLPLVSSATLVKVRTLPGHDVYISTWVPDGGQIEAPKKYVAGIDGRVEHEYTGSSSTFDVLVVVKLGETQKYREQTGPYQSGGTVEVPDLLPAGYAEYFDNQAQDDEETDQGSADEPVNETIDEPEENVTEQESEEENRTNITGNAVATTPKSNRNFMNILYYVLGAIFIIGVLAAIVMFIMTRMKQNGSPQYGMEQVKLTGKPAEYGHDKNLDKIEREIENVEQEIVQYQKRTRLMDAEKRLEDKRQELERLKRGQGASHQPSDHKTHAPASSSHAAHHERKSDPNYRKKVMGY